MENRFFMGIAAGTIIGATAGMLLFPHMDRSTRYKLKKSSTMMKNVAEDALDRIIHWSQLPKLH